MNFFNPLKLRIGHLRAPHSPAALLAALMLTIFGVPMVTSFAQDPTADEQGTEVLTRGPVHEAFAGVISFDSQPGVVVTAAPPALIEEIPPGERPEGDDVAWIPGYWAWDDERNDFLWISGIWRALPPGREWIVGYWGETTEGYQWTSGYWADVSTTETTYLPAPPPTLEEGPNIEAPSSGHGWTPGTWVWRQERYGWSPGYWAEGRSDWDWIPSHYVWTPRGYVYVGGYWDHAVERRGVLFAPVYFDRGVYSRVGYSYSPSIVIDLAMFTSHLFLRPRYDHYYFGDYYAPRYRDGGFYASFSFFSSRRGYDPFHAHRRWKHRHNRDWEHEIEREYRHRCDDESARPPHTWDDMKKRDKGKTGDQTMLATSFDQLSKREDSSMRFQPVDKDDHELLVKRGKEVQESREKRRALEVKDAKNKLEAGSPVTSKVPSIKSPIAAKADSDGKGAGKAPKSQREPGSELSSASGKESGSTQTEQAGRPAMDDKGKDKDDKGKGKTTDAPPVPNTSSQSGQVGRPAMDDKGKDKDDKGKGKTTDAPSVPNSSSQSGQSGGPAMDDKGKGKTSEDKGKDRVPDAPSGKSKQSTPQPQVERPSRVDSGKSQRVAPQKADRPVMKDKGSERKAEKDQKGGKNN